MHEVIVYFEEDEALTGLPGFGGVSEVNRSPAERVFPNQKDTEMRMRSMMGSNTDRMTVVGCSVRDPDARASLRRIVSLEGAELRVLQSPFQSRHVRPLDCCDVLVFDLAPWDHSATEMVCRLRRQRPILPILLYPPHVPGVAKLILECGAMQGVFAHSQFKAPVDITTLRSEVRKLIDSIAGLVFVELVQYATRGAPHVVLDFTRIAVRTLQTERSLALLNVGHLAMELGISTRTLHRSWARTPLPHPKEMLDWLILLFITYQTKRERLPVSRIADAIGLDRQRAYRIRKRLLPDGARARTSNLDQAFDLPLLAFLERCGVQRSDADGIKAQLFA